MGKQYSMDFEAKLSELNQIVERMEQEQLTLEQSLENFKRGVLITQECQKALQEAEQSIQLLESQSFSEAKIL